MIPADCKHVSVNVNTRTRKVSQGIQSVWNPVFDPSSA